MKRLVVLSLLAAMLLPACGGAPPEAVPTPPPTTAATEAAEPADTPVPEPMATATTELPTATPEPTATPVLEEPSPTPEPTSTPQPTATATTGPVVVFRDDFNGALAEGWGWLRQESTYWNLTDAPGSLRITLQDGFIALSSAKNVLVRNAPSGNFEIATFVRFTPTSNYQLAGLVVYQDEANYLQFGRAFCDSPGACVGDGVYFDNQGAGEGFKTNYGSATVSQSQAYLRLRREGNTYTGYYSDDGTNWTVVGQDINNSTSLRVGLIAAQAMQAETTADFDYFTITTLP